MLPNDDAEDILRMTRSRLETYLKEVSPEDLKRSPETRAALFGAMDHVRCHVPPVYSHESQGTCDEEGQVPLVCCFI